MPESDEWIEMPLSEVRIVMSVNGKTREMPLDEFFALIAQQLERLKREIATLVDKFLGKDDEVCIFVSKDTLFKWLACYVYEQDWGDYADESDDLAKDILERNKVIREMAKSKFEGGQI
ncbi:MAG: hypothetical protein DRJ38_00445 [Thermoprotei archaeon]|nr:MAG: hypothetical protein DRJ38_00445 [Thermoprotei archaeon]